VTPVLTDDQAGPLMAKAYSWSGLYQNKKASIEPAILVGSIEQLDPNLYPINCIIMNNYSRIHLSIRPLSRWTTSK
jgi:hypothetical protein